jgi:hypothetical protein
MSIADRVRVRDVKVLSDDWYVLKKTTFKDSPPRHAPPDR